MPSFAAKEGPEAASRIGDSLANPGVFPEIQARKRLVLSGEVARMAINMSTLGIIVIVQ